MAIFLVVGGWSKYLISGNESQKQDDPIYILQLVLAIRLVGHELPMNTCYKESDIDLPLYTVIISQHSSVARVISLSWIVSPTKVGRITQHSCVSLETNINELWALDSNYKTVPPLRSMVSSLPLWEPQPSLTSIVTLGTNTRFADLNFSMQEWYVTRDVWLFQLIFWECDNDLGYGRHFSVVGFCVNLE